VLFDLIPQFGKAEREQISSLFGKKGGSTPDFKVLASRLLRLVTVGTEHLIEIAEANLVNIDLGPPELTTQEMWTRLNDRNQF